MPTRHKSNRPITSDPFQNPVLGFLRGRYATDFLSEREQDISTVHFQGDWLGLQSSEKGAQRLKDAVIACFEARGMQVRSNLDINKKDNAPFTELASDDEKRIVSHDGVVLAISPTSRRPEFTMHFTLPKSQEATAQKAIQDIIDSSRKIQAEQGSAIKKK